MRGTVRAVALLGLIAAAGCPANVTLVVESGTGGDTDSGTSTGGMVDTTAPATTAGSSDGGTSSMVTTDPGTGPDPDTSAGTTVSVGSTSGESTGGCPPGSEGCPCDLGATCDDGLECTDGTCMPPPSCLPIDTDPHQDEGSATMLPMLNCGIGVGLGAIGTIDGAETDWFTFFGTSALGCPEQPGATVTSPDPLDVCVYAECANGAPFAGLVCAAGSSVAMSPMGRTGCCGTDSASVDAYDCGGSADKDVDVWVSIGSDVPLCTDYTLDLQF